MSVECWRDASQVELWREGGDATQVERWPTLACVHWWAGKKGGREGGRAHVLGAASQHSGFPVPIGQKGSIGDACWGMEARRWRWRCHGVEQGMRRRNRGRASTVHRCVL